MSCREPARCGIPSHGNHPAACQENSKPSGRRAIGDREFMCAAASKVVSSETGASEAAAPNAMLDGVIVLEDGLALEHGEHVAPLRVAWRLQGLAGPVVAA